MSDYLNVSRVWLQEGTFVGADNVERQIVRVELEIDLTQANRLAASRNDRFGLTPSLLADDAREIATPITDALVANGFGQEP